MKLLICTFSLIALGVHVVWGSEPGKTTRYWDCCKPSCSWPDTHHHQRTFVQSCDKSGAHVTGASVTNVCGGGGVPGKSYMCNSQQPFAVNSSLAFGFAAAHILNQTAENWCCACYELTFTSTAVVGKKMVVQLTNQGGDPRVNLFDIQMPGGGVGAFTKGCVDQWGTPVEGWGARWGGVHNNTECSLLPKELQTGCEFRFGWFGGASNPAVTMQRVQCPKTLTTKTGCQRNDDSTIENKDYVNL